MAPGGTTADAQTAASEAARSPWWPALVFVQAGGGKGADAVTAGAQWSWPVQPLPFAGGALSGHVELAIAHWRTHNDVRGRAVSTQVGIAPMLRYTSPRWPQWFIDAALGFNAIAPVFRYGYEDFSTVFNFSEHIGIGYRPSGSAWEWTLRYQHFSNAGIREPNPGQDFFQLRLSRRL